MTLEEVKQRIKDIEECKADYEAAHSMEDALYFDVLASIAAGLCENPEACCDEATKTKEIDFNRYCS